MAQFYYKCPTGDGWKNLATDEFFLDSIGKNDILLNIYINENAVIIGKNQNAWKECNLTAMEKDGVQLVRRVSGGGAVYHDRGNVNFSFIAGEKLYDVERQLKCILSAVRSVGIDAEFSGRNDILASGKKFSGNAFCGRHGRRQHHGTLLVCADMSRLAGYLNVSEKKIKSKGISSVRSRVCNLRDLNPQLTPEIMTAAVRSAFEDEYGACTAVTPDAAALEKIQALYEKHRSWEWRLGNTPQFESEFYTRFDWGEIQIFCSMQDAVVCEAKVYSDALDPELPGQVEHAVLGSKYSELPQAILTVGNNAEILELSEWLKTQL